MERIAVLLMVAVLCFSAFAEGEAPPLPCHNVEGNSGVFITSTAYLVNPPAEGETFGKPAVSVSAAWMKYKNFQSLAFTQNILGDIEVGYAVERLGLGDWPDDVADAGLGKVDHHVQVHNFNLRYMAIKEGGLDCDWMPAVTIGAHMKWNEGIDEIDRQLGGACGSLGVDHTFGTEFTAVASKTFTDVLPKPLILSAGVRNGDAIHTGFFGFAGERRTTFECSAIYFLTDRLLFATEFRQKSDLLNQCSAGGKHLIKAENDWFDICLGYVLNENTTIAGGYANFGNVANHPENNVWAIQLKYEF